MFNNRLIKIVNCQVKTAKTHGLHIQKNTTKIVNCTKKITLKKEKK